VALLRYLWCGVHVDIASGMFFHHSWLWCPLLYLHACRSHFTVRNKGMTWAQVLIWETPNKWHALFWSLWCIIQVFGPCGCYSNKLSRWNWEVIWYWYNTNPYNPQHKVSPVLEAKCVLIKLAIMHLL
jgi:hypothetical protein